MPRKDRAPGDPEMVFTTSGMGITAQGDIGGVMFAFEQHIDATADEHDINEIADRMRRVLARQKAQTDLGEKLLALQIAKERIADAPGRIEREQKALGIEKARQRAQFENEQATGKRSNVFRLSLAQEKALKSFDDRIESVALRCESEKAQMEADLPLIEKQIARLRAIIAGQDPDAEEPLALAAE